MVSLLSKTHHTSQFSSLIPNLKFHVSYCFIHGEYKRQNFQCALKLSNTPWRYMGEWRNYRWDSLLSCLISLFQLQKVYSVRRDKIVLWTVSRYGFRRRQSWPIWRHYHGIQRLREAMKQSECRVVWSNFEVL